jgi:hypothetical protein
MPAFNIFIGGSGVRSAAELARRSSFYRQPIGDFLAIDTEPNDQGDARTILGQRLKVADLDDFKNDVVETAMEVLRQPWTDTWTVPRVSLPLERSQAETIVKFLQANAGLYQLRGGGWLALEALNPGDTLIADVVTRASSFLAAANSRRINIVASIAGGTGSGLFIPLISRLQAAFRSSGIPLPSIHLILVTHTPFLASWRNAGELSAIFRSRGLSGAYAAMREVAALSGSFDPAVSRFERRPVGRWDPRVELESVQWIGARDVDSHRPPADAFWEASRIVALMQDDGLASDLAKAGLKSNSVLPSFTSLEYRKLEVAREWATQSAIEELDAALGDGGDLSRVLDSASSPSILAFIRAERNPPLVLRDAQTAQAGTLEQLKLTGETPDGRATGGLHATISAEVEGRARSLASCNVVPEVPRGEQLETGAHALDHDGWQRYVARLTEALERADVVSARLTTAVINAHKQETDLFLWHELEGILRGARDRARPRSPALGTARRAVLQLVEDLGIAGRLFARPVWLTVRKGTDEGDASGQDSVLVDPKVQEARVAALRVTLAGMFEPKTPSIRFGWLITTLLVVLIIASLGAVVARAFSPGLQLPGQTPPDLVLVAVAVLCFVGLFSLNKYRTDNRIGEPQQRREAENELVRAWSWLIVCRQSAELWAAADMLAESWVGRVPGQSSAVGAAPGSNLGDLLQSFSRLTSLLEEARTREAVRLRSLGDRPPGIVDAIKPAAGRIPPGEWPDLQVVAESGAGQIRQLGIATAAGTTLSSRMWIPAGRRTLAEEQYLNDRQDEFLSDVEQRFLDVLGPDGASNQIVALPSRLSDFLEDGSFADFEYNSPAKLAQHLETLARAARDRGFPARTSRGAIGASTTWLVTPTDPACAACVNRAIDFATQQRGKYPELNRLLSAVGGEPTPTAFVGEAIAVVQFGRFAWPGQQGTSITDFDDAQRHHFAADPESKQGGNPEDHNDYNQTNAQFYLIPELAAAASIETELRRGEPLPSVLVPRLYGTNLARGANVPTMLDLFYLADAIGMLGEELTTIDGVDRRRHFLHDQSTNGETLRFDLVSYNAIGAVRLDDELGVGRRRFLVLDAFIAAMGYQGGNAAAGINIPEFNNPLAPQIEGSSWPLNQGVLDSLRSELLSAWRKLGSDAKARNDTYSRMQSLAKADALQIAEGHEGSTTHQANRDGWLRACEATFKISVENLKS